MGFCDLMIYPWFDRAPAYLKTVGIDYTDYQDGSLAQLTIWRNRMLSDPAVRDSSYPEGCYVKMLESRRSGKPSPDVGLDIQKAALLHIK
ncbi:hypothetical protein BV898_00539 [Hypsibius exemplaris]|uniref:GST N-terminal domain-containing protein n=1 Tax=Hypsibius exemplaris TaxID=2072580 RepID=A0A1W0XDS4_HYPEX|nr:hypothetical protein BV898_00539 [Hypsibius exemplaris]